MRPIPVLLLVFSWRAADAQIIESPRPRLRDQFVFSVTAIGGIPLGEFRKNENGGGGMEVMLGFQPVRRQPLNLRAQIGALIYGRINRDVEEEWCDFSQCYTETVYYDSRSHMMFTFHGGPELTPIKGRHRPFIFALAGYTVFHSSATLGYPSGGGSAPSDNLFTSSNFSTAYGGGIRFMDEKQGRPPGFELSAHVVRNAKADYLTERGLTRSSNGTWVVRPLRGAANVLILKVGIWAGPNVPWFDR